MKKFELWLDESGDFDDIKHQSSDYWQGSLVGGALIDLGNYKKNAAKIFEDKMHACELEKNKSAEIVLPILKEAKGKGMEFIIFQNDKKVNIVDNNVTYLNVLADGIVKLIKKLLVKYESIDIGITYAARKSVGKDRTGIIEKSLYTEKLKEKLEIEFVKNAIHNKLKNLKYSLRYVNTNSSAAIEDIQKTDMADIICNTFITRWSGKFGNKDRELIDILYDKEYIFFVFERTAEERIKLLCDEGDISQALFELFVGDERELTMLRNKYIDNVYEQIRLYEDKYVSYELTDFIHKLKLIVEYSRDNVKNINLLTTIRSTMENKLYGKKKEIKEFTLNIELLILEAANHSGDNRLEEEQINRLIKAAKNINFKIENLELYFRIINRKAVYENNIFDFNGAILTTTALIKPLEDIVSLLNDPEIYGQTKSEIKADSLGKAYGTRLQARTFLIMQDKTEAEKAREDSDMALKCFTNDSDIGRQYQYRSQIECECGNYEAAVKYLFKSFNFVPESDKNYDELFKSIDEAKKFNIFQIMHTSRIIGKASMENKSIASELFKSLSSSNSFRNFSKNQLGDITKKCDHPYQIILWNIGRYYINNNSINSAVDYYDAAIKICMKNKKYYTMMGIGLGIMAEKAAMIKKAGFKFKNDGEIAEREFIRSYREFIKEIQGTKISDYFKVWEPVVNSIEKESADNIKIESLIDLSNRITY